MVGEIHPDIVDRFGLRPEPVIYFQIALDALSSARLDTEAAETRFQSLSRFPAANRDLALLAPSDVPAGQIQQLIQRVRLVERTELFDVYTGENVPEGMRSLAFRIWFRAEDRTLTAEELNRAMNGLTRVLEREAGATLRG